MHFESRSSDIPVGWLRRNNAFPVDRKGEWRSSTPLRRLAQTHQQRHWRDHSAVYQPASSGELSSALFLLQRGASPQ
jgi:hypothetical protein